jgi:tetratricopeptide (TPR) repeat protein
MNRFVCLLICGAITISTASAFQTQPKPKSNAEIQAIQAMFSATPGEAQIAAAEKLLLNFADTEFKSMALFLEADDYMRMGQFEKSIVFGEQSLAADPQNYQAMLLLARQYAAHTNENDLDKEEKLSKASTYATDALGVIPNAPKPNPQITDAQWDGFKKDYMSQAHEALGMVADVRKKYDAAATEYKTALDGASTPDPSTMVRYATAEEHLGNYDEAIAMLDKAIADPNSQPVVKQFATAEKNKAIAAKNAPKNAPKK